MKIITTTSYPTVFFATSRLDGDRGYIVGTRPKLRTETVNVQYTGTRSEDSRDSTRSQDPHNGKDARVYRQHTDRASSTTYLEPYKDLEYTTRGVEEGSETQQGVYRHSPTSHLHVCTHREPYSTRGRGGREEPHVRPSEVEVVAETRDGTGVGTDTESGGKTL